ncbi:MAG: ATP-binding protein [Saprospiraceae bacterium]
MSSLIQYILLFLFILFPIIIFGQNAIKYDWESIPAHESMEQLKVFQAIDTNRTEVESWEDRQRVAYLKKGIEAAKQLQSDDDIIFFSKRLGNRYYFMDSISQAIQYIKYPIDMNYDTLNVARAYNRLGYIYFDLGDYNKALEHLFESVRYGKMLNRNWETYPFGNISNVYKHLEDYDNAIKYTKASMVIDAKADFPEREYGYVYNYTALLILSEKNNQLDSSFQYIDLIKKNIAKLDTVEGRTYQTAINYAHVTIADFYIKNNLLSKAKIHLDLAKKSEDFNQEAYLLTSGRYFLKKKNYGRVKALIEQYDSTGVQNFQSTENLIDLKIDYYTAIGDLKTVIELQKELLKTQKEKFGNDRLRYGTFASAEFRNLEQQQKISELENRQVLEQLRSRNRTFGGLIAFLLIVGIAVFLWYQSHQRKKYNIVLEQKVAERTKDLEQANYELRTFNYIASHDIKEPIRVIGGYAGLIFKRLPNDLKENLGDYFDTIKRSTKQLYTLIEDFAYYSTLSKDEGIKTEPVDLNSLTYNVIDNLQESIVKYNGEVVIEDLPTINSNNTFLFTALKNLIENGLKYNESKTPTVKVSYSKTENYHQIIVSDNGIGIDENYHKKIFEMFKLLHNRGAYEGSGIGLAIVKLSVEKLGGRVEVESEVGKGTRFMLQLPK